MQPLNEIFAHFQDCGHDGRVLAVPEEHFSPVPRLHAEGRLQNRQGTSIQTLPGLRITPKFSEKNIIFINIRSINRS